MRRRPRAWGRPGHDYEVQWADDSFKEGFRFDWHLEHHLKSDPSDAPLPWEEDLEDEENNI